MLVLAGAELNHILFITGCQNLSGLHQCLQLSAKLMKAGINICVKSPDEDGHDRETQGIKQQRCRNPQTAANDPRCHSNLLTVLLKLSDARETL